MSAIVTHTTAHPSESCQLIHHGSPPPNTPHALVSTYTPSTPFTPSPGSGAGAGGKQGKVSKHLDRSAPLRDSLSNTRFLIICASVWSSNLVFAFQSTAIPTLAPTISSAFNHAELAAYLGSVFSLASAGVIPVFGVLMETLGRKFAMVTACFFFGLGTLLCALSPNIWMLIGARAVSGLGGGGLLTVSSVIVTDLVPLRDRGFYQGIMMSIFGAGSMIGGPTCGWVADRFGWQWAFWIQLPLIAFCVTMVTTFLPEPPIPPTHKTLSSGLASLDWLGSGLLLGSVTALLLGLSFHTSFLKPWSSPDVWGELLASIVGLGMFFMVETRAKNPIVPMSLLKSRHRMAIMSSGLFLSIGNQAFMFQVPAYFTVVLDTSTAQAGLILSVCGGLGLALGSMIAGQHIKRGGRYRQVGIIALVPGLIAAFVAAAWTPDWSWGAYYLTFFPSSLGYSVFLCCQLIALISAVDSKSMPKATALLYTVRTLGVALGVSIGGSIQIGALTTHLKLRFADHPDVDQIISSILHSKSAIRQLPAPLDKLALDAYASSISTVWVVSGFIALVTIFFAWGIQEKDMGESGKKGRVAVGEGESEDEDED